MIPNKITQLNLFQDLDYKPPLVICWGKGVDSTAALVGFAQKGIRPDMILFAEVGNEKSQTNAYDINQWIEQQGFPLPITTSYLPKNFKNWPPYYTLLENCLTNVTLPSITYGRHSCSAKWKIAPMNKYLKGWLPAQECWANGKKVIKAIGFEDSLHEIRRAERGSATFAIQTDEADKYDLWFPLQEWGWDRDRCKQEIIDAGLPLPVKSSCYFCAAMKPWEVDELAPKELWTIVIMEARTRERHLNYAKEKGWPKGEGIPLIQGLWRNEVKGLRGATPRPGSMTEYIRNKELLPLADIDKVIAATPTQPFTKEELGFDKWQDWLDNLLKTTIRFVSKEEYHKSR